MAGRTIGLGNGSMDMQFSSKNNVAAKNFIETHSCFNQMTFRTLIDLLPDVLAIHQEFKDNLNFHDDSEGLNLN